jgi:hypothetical protein
VPQLWHCVTALEDQVLKLSAPGVKLVPFSLLFGDSLALILFVSQAALEVGLLNEGNVHLRSFPLAGGQ